MESMESKHLIFTAGARTVCLTIPILAVNFNNSHR